MLTKTHYSLPFFQAGVDRLVKVDHIYPPTIGVLQAQLLKVGHKYHFQPPRPNILNTLSLFFVISIILNIAVSMRACFGAFQ